MRNATKSEEDTQTSPEQAYLSRCRNAVLHNGSANSLVEKLIVDWRKTLLPCAPYSYHSSHKIHKKLNLKNLNKLIKDGNLSHLHIFHVGEFGVTMRIARSPNGPTLYFRVESFTLVRDVIKFQHRHHGGDHKLFTQPPIIVLNQFSFSDKKAHSEDSMAIQIAGEMLRSMIDVATKENVSHMGKYGRILFFSRVSTGDSLKDGTNILIEVRHYTVLGRSASKKTQLIEDLSKGTISSSLLKKISQGGDGSQCCEDLVRDLDGNRDVLKSADDESKIQLVEIGPRLTLRLLRIEQGLCGGTAIWPST
ncbi:peter pan protein [Perkinsela sp. CCAP 1560/4]|nr:peter pan protein [Perkinsela sp. CCAP 1560/4]|eukprot:KNH04728.1 peter pan protein [Perkinsela sp. CCAP 1560/4]